MKIMKKLMKIMKKTYEKLFLFFSFHSFTNIDYLTVKYAGQHKIMEVFEY